MAKQKSIKKRLINLISLALIGILSILFLLIDINLDDWAEMQFSNEIKSQTYILKSMIALNENKPQLIEERDILSDDNINEIYYQVWLNNRSVEKSNNLPTNQSVELIKYDIPLNTSRTINVTLPNGDDGLATLSKFTLSENDHREFYLTVYNSEKKLNKVLYTIDIALIFSFIITLLLVRLFARKITLNGLKPLSELNDEIIKTTKSPLKPLLLTDPNIEEIYPIYQSFNHYITHNQNLMQNEKRITSDIAHELKTPIAEIITLAEVHQKFPDDPRIAETFTQDVLDIAREMKNLVSGLLSLQKFEQEDFSCNESVNLCQQLHETAEKLALDTTQLDVQVASDLEIKANSFSLSVIFRNLLENAFYYKSPESSVLVTIKNYGDNLYLYFENSTKEKMSEIILQQLTTPLFKLDRSRTNDTHYGLGLTIVQRLCQKNHYDLHLQQDDNLTFRVMIKIPLLNEG
ncbi:ATP-binding protein [Vibrio viridaestus]|uniref:histidine kinase n=1 Tax=Vibrio viridaestus TaxID=2487322 RepID=A0A3N9TGN0_9VIBR|nr:HAMP domain-containing sensor histidine kinase [Vibrio viridaestus]RQW62625.1 sensor histidine kinase [Vibrio viridaestus]